CARAVGGFDFW
nr:immunoglobulin heavy chain junction region [Mus musculus]MBK4186605.1 immunoglobulin heavy chain junction region [Mus musculus]MBK4186608.1 immunoglobulin heavy chain junction region [Mus musculus]MBK4186609.1 immunoglobulin heavy chain junction region [Mus musculus]MBK4186610.1 immunoglobulin heavy chain junction region [Mus musculus]